MRTLKILDFTSKTSSYKNLKEIRLFNNDKIIQNQLYSHNNNDYDNNSPKANQTINTQSKSSNNPLNKKEPKKKSFANKNFLKPIIKKKSFDKTIYKNEDISHSNNNGLNLLYESDDFRKKNTIKNHNNSNNRSSSKNSPFEKIISNKKSSESISKIKNNLLNPLNQSNPTIRRNFQTQRFCITAKPNILKNNTFINNHDSQNVYLAFKNKGFGKTQAGKMDDGSIKENQDSYIIIQNIFGLNFHLYGIMDGHGTNGHLVSRYVKQGVRDYFTNQSHYSQQSTDSLNETIIYEQLICNNYQLIKNFYYNIDDELSKQNFNIQFSGTTCVIIFQIGKMLICSNTGDSRGILIKMANSKFYCDPLSFDHKPMMLKEKNRIENCGGEVCRAQNLEGEDDGPYRIWVKGEVFPGLAVSRSIGDSVAESIGVIAEPDIIEKEINEECKYFILASDGVWDYLEGDDIIKIVTPFFIKGNPKGAVNEIVGRASDEWKKYGDNRDDISVIISFIGNNKKRKIGLL